MNSVNVKAPLENGADCRQPASRAATFADLTKDTVIGWVKEAIGGADKVAEIEAALQVQLDEQKAPTKANGVPWS